MARITVWVTLSNENLQLCDPADTERRKCIFLARGCVVVQLGYNFDSHDDDYPHMKKSLSKIIQTRPQNPSLMHK